MPLWIWWSKYNHKQSAGTSTHYIYNCTQNTNWQHAPLKSHQGVKNHDKESMETFDCSGWIHITLSDLYDIVFIKLMHCEDHVPYCPIDIPKEVERYVQDNLKYTPTQVSNYHQVLSAKSSHNTISSGLRFWRNIQSCPSHINPSINCGHNCPAVPGKGMRMKFSQHSCFLKSLKYHHQIACTPLNQYQSNRTRAMGRASSWTTVRFCMWVIIFHFKL